MPQIPIRRPACFMWLAWKAGFAGRAGWWVCVDAGDIPKGEAAALAPEQGADGDSKWHSQLAPPRSLGEQHASLFTGEGFYWDCTASFPTLLTVFPYHFSLDVGSPGSPVGCCSMLCATGLHGPVERDVLPTLGISSVARDVFCFFGPAKLFLAGGL